MRWIVKDKESVVKTCFAFFPKRIGDYRVWLSKYYKTWDYVKQEEYSGYAPHWFVYEEAALRYVKDKINNKISNNRR